MQSVGDTEKLAAFLREYTTFGTLHGFRYFQLQLQTREELFVTVKNPSTGPVCACALVQRLSCVHRRAHTHSTEQGEPAETKFLIGSYSKYKTPHVWVR